jgi:hypothetical protein
VPARKTLRDEQTTFAKDQSRRDLDWFIHDKKKAPAATGAILAQVN